MLDVLIPSLVSVYCLTIIFLLWRASKANKVALFLNYATMGTLCWTLSILLTVTDKNLNHVIFWSRLSFFFPILIAYSLSKFNGSFISVDAKRAIYNSFMRTIINLMVFAGVVFAFISFTPLIIADVHNLRSTFGPLQSYYSYFILFCFLLVNVNLTRGYFLTKTAEKTQFGYVLLGVAISSIAGIVTNLFVPMFTHLEIRYLGPLGVVFFLTFTSYAIIRKKLFDINIFVTELFSVFLFVSLILNVIYSRSNLEIILKTVILVVATYSSLRLIISAHQEREQNILMNKLNRQLEKDKEKLLELDHQKDEFLMMATHELTTPVTAIRGKLSMAVDEKMANLDDEQIKFFAPALDAVNRLNHTSQELVSTAMINQGKFAINREVADLDAIISEIVEKFKKTAKIKNNIIIYKPDFKAKNIKIDSRRVKEVVLNLIDNANHFTEKGEICIKTKLDKDSDALIVSVSDSGMGIDQAAQEKLFSKFSQVGRFDNLNPSEQQGAGLGLYISKKVIQLHGGKIWFESQKDRGTTFHFTLPISTTAA